MFEYNFAKLVAHERKDELSGFLKTKHMLKEAEGVTPGVSKTRRLVMRFAPVVVVISVFVFLIFA